jgi:hypothetical protein
MNSLKFQTLDHNQLTDTIPSSLLNDTNLMVFSVEHNQLSGQRYADQHGYLEYPERQLIFKSATEIGSFYTQQGLGKRRYSPPSVSPIIKYPEKITLGNAPNPFQGTTNIKFGIPLRKSGDGINDGQRVILRIYDSQGKIVRTLVNSVKIPGYYEAKWDGRNTKGNSLSTGIYIYKLTVGSAFISKKMILK